MQKIQLFGGPKHGQKTRVDDDTWGLEFWDADGTWSYYKPDAIDPTRFIVVEVKRWGD